MNFSPILQNGAIDAYVYTGYIHNFHDLLDRYGPTYYSVRFGHILPNRALASLFGALPGYLLWRYLVVLAASVPFYVLLRQRYGRPVACTVVTVLVTSPFLARTVNWDYVSATAVPCLFGAVCLLHIEHRRRVLLDLAAGFLAGLMIHSNLFGIAPLAAFATVYCVAGLVSGRGVRGLARRFAWLAIGPVVLTGAGWLYYSSIFDRWDVWSSTVFVVSFLVGGGAAEWRTPDAAWLLRDWSALMPLLLAATALLASVGTRVSIQAAALGTGAACAAGLLYVHQFLLNGNTLELLWYFQYLLPSVFVLLAVIVGAIWERSSSRVTIACGVILVVCAAGPWILLSMEQLPLAIVTFERHHLLMAVAAALVGLARALPSWRTVMPVLASAALGLSFFSGFAQPGYARTINSRAHPQHDEKDVYEVALQFIRAVPRLSERPGVIRFWYSDEPPSNPMWSVQSTFLWGYSRLHAEGRGIPDLGEEELALVRAPDLKWLTLLAERPEQIELARAALTAHGVRYQTSMQRVLSAGDYRLYVEFLELRPAS
jgi:MFS family permease